VLQHGVVVLGLWHEIQNANTQWTNAGHALLLRANQLVFFALQRNSLVLIRLARSFDQALRRTYSPRLGAAARASLILIETIFRYPNQHRWVPL
jgi:hypothetical protein